MKNYNFFQKYKIFFSGFGRYFLLLGIFGIVTSSMSFIEPIIDANIVTNITTFHIEKALFLAMILLLLRMLMQIFYYISNVLFSHIKFKCILNIRMKVCNAYMQLKSKTLDKTESGVFLERIKNDPTDITELFSSIQDYIIGIITNIGIIFYVYFIHPLMGICYTIAILVLFLIQKYRIAVLVRRHKENKIIEEENTTVLNNLIHGVKDIKLLNFKTNYLQYIESTFKRNFKKRFETNKETYQYWALYYCVRETFSLFILLLGGYLVVQKSLSVTNLLILWMYRSNIYLFVINTSNLTEKLSTFNLYAGRVIEIMNSSTFEQETYGNKEIKQLLGNVEFQNVSFAYQNQNVLTNVSFQIEANQTVAFVGRSGAGKTTIFNLIAKMYETEKGTIYFDQYPIGELSEESIRNNIAVVGQNPYLFHMTIKENIMIVNSSLKEKEMKKICKQVCLDKWIESLPNQYDTVVGEGGVNLSGGERQRLAMARALAKNTPILLLDEATSSLDNTTQQKIQETLRNIKKDKTIILIAHRLSTIIDCDKIFVVDRGKIIAQGTHEFLLKNSELYHELYMQEM